MTQKRSRESIKPNVLQKYLVCACGSKINHLPKMLILSHILKQWNVCYDQRESSENKQKKKKQINSTNAAIGEEENDEG